MHSKTSARVNICKVREIQQANDGADTSVMKQREIISISLKRALWILVALPVEERH
jgi:hypothetical protein